MDEKTLPVLSSARLSLRWISKEDVDSVFEIFSNPEVMRYWSTPPLANKQAALDLISEIQMGLAMDAMFKWGVSLRENNKVIGTVTLFNLDFNNKRAELGYALGRSYWGKGYIHEALQTVLAHVFDVLNFRRLEADVDPRNALSIKTLERLGFRREGFLRERWHVAGEIQDAYFYGLLKREWLRPT
jgi:RimJ/RimL family protein N-acetyltransferase